MSNAAPWTTTAGNTLREVARTTENPTTKLLAEGLTALTEGLRKLFQISKSRTCSGDCIELTNCK